MAKTLTATLSDVFCYRGETLYAIATFSDGFDCKVSFEPGRTPSETVLFRRAGKWGDGDQKWEPIDFGNANGVRLAAADAALRAIFAEEVEKDRLDREAVEADNEARLARARATWSQRDAGPLLYEALLKAIGCCSDVALVRQCCDALAAAEGLAGCGSKSPLPLWRYRLAGETYFSGLSVSAPNADHARVLAAASGSPGRDKFGATRFYLPEEFEVELVSAA
jgi:hypothetical protein